MHKRITNENEQKKKQTIPVQSTLIILLMKINVQPCRINKFIFCYFQRTIYTLQRKKQKWTEKKHCSKRTNTKSSEIGLGIFIILEHITSPRIPSPFSSLFIRLTTYQKKNAFRLLHDTDRAMLCTFNGTLCYIAFLYGRILSFFLMLSEHKNWNWSDTLL